MYRNFDTLILLFYLYHLYLAIQGRIAISVINVLPILILSDKYNVQDLIKLCMDYMSSHIVKGKYQ